MAENPVLALARLLGGVVLMQGRLGHQVLGQMLVSGSSDAAIAAAAAVVAGTARQRNAAVQIALRTAAPALAVHVLLRGEEERIERKLALLAGQMRRLDERRRSAGRRERELEKRAHAIDAAAGGMTAIERQNRKYAREVERLSARLRSAARRPAGVKRRRSAGRTKSG